MHVDTVAGVVDHLLVDLVDAALHGLGQSAASDDGGEVERDVVLLERVEHELCAEVDLIDHLFEAGQVLGRVRDVGAQQLLVALVDRHLGRRRSRVND